MTNSTDYGAVRDTAENLGDEALRAGRDLAGKASETANDLRNEVKTQADRLAVSIREKPIQSAMIAAGLGFLLAVVARR